MIITVSIQPAVEHFFAVSPFRAGHQHQAAAGFTAATGPGLNVARALRDLGEEVTAVVSAGGRRGREIEERLLEEDLPYRIVGVRRENPAAVTVYDGGAHTSVGGGSGEFSDPDLEAVVATVRGLLPARCIVLGGVPPRSELYVRIAALGVPVVLHACGSHMEDLLRVGNVLVACADPQECLEVLGCEEPAAALRTMARGGARWAVVAEEPGTAIYRTGSRTFRVEGLEARVALAAGATDAMLAGLLHALGRGPTRAIAFAAACGVHSLGREDVGNLEPTDCEALAAAAQVVEIGGDAARERHP